MSEKERVFQISPSYREFVFESIKDLEAVMNAFDKAIVVDKSYLVGPVAVIDDATASYTVTLMPVLDKKAFEEAKAEKAAKEKAEADAKAAAENAEEV